MLGPDGGVAGCGESVLGGGRVVNIWGMGIRKCLCLLVGPFWKELGCPAFESLIKAAGFGLQIFDHLGVLNIMSVIRSGRRQCSDGGVEIDEPGDDPVAFEVMVRFTELSAVEHPLR